MNEIEMKHLLLLTSFVPVDYVVAAVAVKGMVREKSNPCINEQQRTKAPCMR